MLTSAVMHFTATGAQVDRRPIPAASTATAASATATAAAATAAGAGSAKWAADQQQ
jgi:hypothetical protein